MKHFDIIVAHTEDLGIGYKGKIPWHNKSDMKFFRNKTSNTKDGNKMNAIIMERLTWESLPVKPLKFRFNIVISSTIQRSPYKNLAFCSSFKSAHQLASSMTTIESIFVIGGQLLYNHVIESPYCRSIFATSIVGDYECDRKITNYSTKRYKTAQTIEESNTHTIDEFKQFRFRCENGYLNLCDKILKFGEVRSDRTGTGTKSLFGEKLEFDLSQSFPLLTTKRVFWRAVVAELLWFISGSTDSNILKQQNIKIWEGNTSREFLDARGLNHFEVGDIGAGYGFQWRHSGAKYQGCKHNYTGEGVDQLANMIEGIKTDPYGRRHIINAWNPSALQDMALPPCHMMAQFYVSRDGTLSCQMYQRSADMFLGEPFNIASYALLVYIVCHLTELKPKKLVIVIGDAHVYLNHVDAMKTQLERTPRTLPTLSIKRKVLSIDDFKADDFDLVGYKPHPVIKAKMAV